MSRTTLCILTAGALAVLSLGLMVTRRQVLGNEIKVPAAPDTWKVTLAVRGLLQPDSRLQTAAPLIFGRQHVWKEDFRSGEWLPKPPDDDHSAPRLVTWSPRVGTPPGAFRAVCEFFVHLDTGRHPSRAPGGQDPYQPPRPRQHLEVTPRVAADHERVTALARRLTEGLDRPADQAEALFHYVDRDLANEPSVGRKATGALACLDQGGGDAGGKSRLLVALLRNRGIPARVVTGLALTKGPRQLAHHWVEAWLHDRWLPVCPTYHHYGRVPATFLVFAFDDLPLVRGRRVRDLDHAFLVERTSPEGAAAAASPLKQLWLSVSLHALPPAEQRLVEFLLLLPPAALIVCVFRNVIGFSSFGTFAPALVGLAFRDLHSLPGLLVFVSLILLGWLLRRALDRFHLLQVPRSAFLLSLVVLVLIGAIVAANARQWPATRYVSLFPMVILTGMIERFWTLETEDGTAASFKTLLSTLLIAACIALALSLQAVADHLFRYPETLGLVMAAQLLLGRYTGYRLSELYRFRDLLRTAPAGGPWVVGGDRRREVSEALETSEV